MRTPASTYLQMKRPTLPLLWCRPSRFRRQAIESRHIDGCTDATALLVLHAELLRFGGLCDQKEISVSRHILFQHEIVLVDVGTFQIVADLKRYDLIVQHARVGKLDTGGVGVANVHAEIAAHRSDQAT